MTAIFERKVDQTVRTEMPEQLWNYPQISDLCASIALIDHMLGVDNGDTMRNTLEMAAHLGSIGDDVGVDIDKCNCLLDIRRMFVKRHNEIVAAMQNVDPDDDYPVHPESIKRIPSSP